MGQVKGKFVLYHGDDIAVDLTNLEQFSMVYTLLV